MLPQPQRDGQVRPDWPRRPSDLRAPGLLRPPGRILATLSETRGPVSACSQAPRPPARPREGLREEAPRCGRSLDAGGQGPALPASRSAGLGLACDMLEGPRESALFVPEL